MARLVSVLLALAAGVVLAACSSQPQYKPGPLANSTPCGVLNADQAAGDTADIDNYVLAANPYLADQPLQVQIQGEMDIMPSLLGECQNEPSELLTAAYNKAQEKSLSETPTPIP